MYEELSGSPRESLNEGNGASIERRFVVPWSNRFLFTESMLGTTHPAFPQLRVVGFDVQPMTEELRSYANFAGADYGIQPAIVTVKYAPNFTLKPWPKDFAKPAHRLGTELRYQIQGSGQFLLTPTSGMRWEQGEGEPDPPPVTEDANASILIPFKRVQLQWDFVDDPPVVRLDDFMGTVNKETYLGCKPETLLFESYDIQEAFRASPIIPHTNTVVINLLQRQIKYKTGGGRDAIGGWNHDYVPDMGWWIRMKTSAGRDRYEVTSWGAMLA